MAVMLMFAYVCLCLLPQACSSLRPNLGVPNGRPNWWKAEGSTKSQPRSGQLLVLATFVGCGPEEKLLRPGARHGGFAFLFHELDEDGK